MPPQYEISTDRRRLDIDGIHRFLRNTYWAKGRTREVVETSLANSLCFGVFHSGHQVAFARVITDYAVIAYLADVFVVHEFRGRGIARLMLQAVFESSELATISTFLLRTRDAHGLYEKFGFRRLPDSTEMMVCDAATIVANRESR